MAVLGNLGVHLVLLSILILIVYLAGFSRLRSYVEH